MYSFRTLVFFLKANVNRQNKNQIESSLEQNILALNLALNLQLKTKLNFCMFNGCAGGLPAEILHICCS